METKICCGVIEYCRIQIKIKQQKKTMATMKERGGMTD
jgi:hypothetical protein